MQNQEEEFDKLTEDDVADNSYRPPAKIMRMDADSEEEFDDEGLEGIDLEDEEDMGSRTIQVGDKNFTFSFAQIQSCKPTNCLLVHTVNMPAHHLETGVKSENSDLSICEVMVSYLRC